MVGLELGVVLVTKKLSNFFYLWIGCGILSLFSWMDEYKVVLTRVIRQGFVTRVSNSISVHRS
jgi:hypothetical protein